MKSANSKCTYTWKKSSHSCKSLVFGWLLCSREVMCLQQHTCESRFFWHSYLSSFPSEIWQFPRLVGLFESGAAAWTLCVAGSSKWRCWTLLVFWTLRQWQLGESLELCRFFFRHQKEGQGSTERCDLHPKAICPTPKTWSIPCAFGPRWRNAESLKRWSVERYNGDVPR